jgi:hypothetical protein
MIPRAHIGKEITAALDVIGALVAPASALTPQAPTPTS